MSSRLFTWFSSLLLFLLVVAASPHGALAASNDEDVEILVQSVLEGEFKSGKHIEALEQLELARSACEGKGCSPKTRARLYIAIGTVLAGGMKQIPEAKEAFTNALREDATASLYSDFITPDIQRAFNDARGVATGSSSLEQTAKSDRKPKKEFSGGGRPPRGWKSAEAHFYYREAVASEKEQDWQDCADYAQASLAAENRVGTRFLAAGCAERSGQWIEALSDYQIVAETGGKTGLYDVAEKAQNRSQELREKIPKIVLRKPANATDLVVKMNGDEVPTKRLGGEIWVNPGQRLVQATGKVDGALLEFQQLVDVAEFETVTIDIKLVPKGERPDPAIMKCMAKAQTRQELAQCIAGGGEGANLNYRMGLEVSGYHDSDHVDVVTPAVTFSVESPTGGWGINGSFLVDVVTTASSDILATASPRWTEARVGPAIGGHKKIDAWDISGGANMSVEPDYTSVGAGIGASVELAQKSITPSLSYGFSYDLSGRSGTPYSVFSYKIHRHSLDGGVGLVLDKATFLSLGATVVLEFGNLSKPYRAIPLFSPETAEIVPPGFSIKGVQDVRLAERAMERVPVEGRQRYAVAGRLAHRFSSSTIRVEERLYTDSWGVLATTTDMRYLVDLNDQIRVWPHVRFHAQTGASFWRLAYEAERDELGVLQLPNYRTGDRELGPYIQATVGGGVRFAFGSKNQFSMLVNGDFIYSRYLDHLFLPQKFGYFGATAFEAEFE
ncbi:DUF3570 domain-containing protein [Chondromyces crocatus]|uniref:Uncharacterized protein n=1 Tax=Chondromyces crocatus TaxID=52 RepID=A0A0K1EMD6_CHOCO|nr:DUF3570 domain-containing protein [Chondromyces crocatus]AKT41981.1 uncharacterized protein CMC5_062030 [Chondromyces crocatus]